jgi:inorganic pyrophosphatase
VDPSRLKLQDEEDKQILQVIIETPKGSRNKYASILIKSAKEVLPAGIIKEGMKKK